jgi:hypothetical protein
VYRGAVEVAVDGQERRIARSLTLPDGLEAQPVRIGLVVEGGLGAVELRIAVPVAVAEGEQDLLVAALLSGETQVRGLLDEELRLLHDTVRVRVEEHHPEVIVDDVEGYLALAHRAADEGPDHVLRVVEQELVPHARGDLGVDEKRVGVGRRVIRHGVRRLEPRRLDEQLLESREDRVVELDHHMGLVDDRRVDLPEAVEEPVGPGVVVGSPGRDDGDALAGWGRGAHQLVELSRPQRAEVQVREEEVLVEVARGERVLGVIAVEEAFPLGDLRRRGR